MSGTYNHVTLIGRLGRDPEVRATQGGKSICNFTIATDNGYGDSKTTDWHRIVCFDKTAETVGERLTKGKNVCVEGRITHRKYTDKDGTERISTEIIASRVIFLDKVEGQGGGQARGSQGGGYDDDGYQPRQQQRQNPQQQPRQQQRDDEWGDDPPRQQRQQQGQRQGGGQGQGGGYGQQQQQRATRQPDPAPTYNEDDDIPF